ncbi:MULTISPECIES: PAS-domain containing protein [unclassified Ruegeria]|uniref:hybrid sensor histidine kinase/response regulator n=1 Tax=unclassified Ruegeria TaxID=2625375 RepID=UPI0014917EAD|nr:MULTISPECIES: PAS-domain containing protein [unclassified Ruegeria]NOC45688.1 response regulator [Ruegeria sp. HKCCD7559]
MLNPDDPPEIQISKQAKIIDALMRRANRQKDVGPSAFLAFQSAIELQQQVMKQSRDLERATTELESARYEREQTRKSLVKALSSMEEGFALFTDGDLNLCNELFQAIFPDMSDVVGPGLSLGRFFLLVQNSPEFVSSDNGISKMLDALERNCHTGMVSSDVIELRGDRWYQLSAQYTSPQNVVILLTDITSVVRRNRDEKETLIDRQEDYLKAVFQNMSSGVCTFSSDTKIMMHNARFREILNLPLSVLQANMPVQTLLDLMRARGLIKADDELRIGKWQHELKSRGWLRKRVRDGSDRVLDIQVNQLPDGGFLVELKDVTFEARATETLENRVMERTAELTHANAKLVQEYEEKARVEEALRIAKERAEAAVSSKTRFLAAASHDLLQPINAAKLMISTLLEITRETELHEMMERLDGAFGSAEQLLHSLLDISRLETADPDTVSPTEVSLATMIAGIQGDQTLVAESKNVTLDVVPCSEIVKSDPVYLLRSIQNLVVNAIQYTEPGGRVLVGCRRRGDKVILQVWDTGIGIARKDQERVFEEFTRAENVPLGSGMGLGLSVVDRACRLLGHKLSLRSKPGIGSVFSIEMDRVESGPSTIEPLDLLANTGDVPLDFIILVIENDRDVLFGTTQWLEQNGASVLPARSPKEALQFIKDIGMPPDIILADYQLDDGETGVMAIHRIREMTQTQVPAILITADRSEALRKDGLRHEISVMAKPVKLPRLRSLIFWKIQNALHAQTLNTDKSRR